MDRPRSISAQTPGDIIVLASADTEIALLAAAQARRRAADPAAPTLRLAPVMRLGHNFSVDLYMETVARARLVDRAAARRQRLLALRGRAARRDLPRPRHPAGAAAGRRQARSRTGAALDLAADGCRRLWRYLAEGGPANADNFLRYAASLIGGEAAMGGAGAVAARRALLAGKRNAGPRRDRGGVVAASGGVVPIVFYRALVQSGNTAPVDALVRALTARRLRPLPVFVQSLKDAEAAALLASVLRRIRRP